jgi:hypothetical protein
MNMLINKSNIVAVKYLGQTNTKPNRLKITNINTGKSVTVCRDYQYNMSEQLNAMGYTFMFNAKDIGYWTMNVSQ